GRRRQGHRRADRAPQGAGRGSEPRQAAHQGRQQRRPRGHHRRHHHAGGGHRRVQRDAAGGGRRQAGADPDRRQAGPGHQDPDRRNDVHEGPERAHRAEKRRGGLMTTIEDESVATDEATASTTREQRVPPRFKTRYRDEILPALRDEFGY